VRGDGAGGFGRKRTSRKVGWRRKGNV